ncbi:MAG: hypothetical protein KJN71_07825, partial [Acidimicrobiia bacterium]|nr:hypothetical protein [Acidimicrobiia bacterium]
MSKPLFEVSVRPTRKLGIATFTGVCEGSAIIGAMDAMFGHHDWDRSFDSLWDYSGVESFDVQIAEIDAMMSRS